MSGYSSIIGFKQVKEADSPAVASIDDVADVVVAHVAAPHLTLDIAPVVGAAAVQGSAIAGAKEMKKGLTVKHSVYNQQVHQIITPFTVTYQTISIMLNEKVNGMYFYNAHSMVCY